MGETTWCPSPSWEKRVNAFVLGTALMIKGIAVRRQSLVSSNAENFHWNNCWVAKGPKLECPTLFVNLSYPKNLKFGEGLNSAREFSGQVHK